jgi:hypothetical protein
MTTVKTRIRVGPDGSLSGQAKGLPAGEHDAEIVLVDTVVTATKLDPDAILARVRALQEEVARSPDEIIGYNDRGHVD